MHLTALAPAKINLYLHITGKRPDDYHLLESLVVLTDVCDKVEVAPADKLTLTVTGSYAESLRTEADNIVLKAARKLAAVAGIAPNAQITLHKEIPVGAGLGGGSSDAAATLRLLVKHWQLDMPEKKLREIALELGADVPVMLGGKAAFMSGVGEILEPVRKVLLLYVVLVNPGVHLSTPAVYNQGVAAFSIAEQEVSRVFETLPKAMLIDFLKERNNDLEPPAITLQPVIREVLEVIIKQPGCRLSRMSGSGATCFGLFNDAQAAQQAAEKIQATKPGWWVREAKVGN